MMAANVATREEDMTGRSKTQKDAIETITLLLAAGADVNGADTQGRTALHGAALWGLTDVVTFLHENGADLNVKDKRGLHAARHALGLAGGFGFDGSVRRRARGDGQGDSRARRHARDADSRRNHSPVHDRNAADPQDGDRN